jgi:hypothetical protein
MMLGFYSYERHSPRPPQDEIRPTASATPQDFAPNSRLRLMGALIRAQEHICREPGRMITRAWHISSLRLLQPKSL